jgi:microcystin-dependent protein
MALEDLTGTNKYISNLVAANPSGRPDKVEQGDDHLRGIKNVLINSFPNISGAVTLTQGALNGLPKFALGMVGLFIAVPTTGWEVADGHTIALATYPDFFAWLFGGTPPSTYVLPDVRGEFLRALDLSRGVDAGRTILSAQADGLKTHTHIQNAHTHTYTAPLAASTGQGGSQSSMTTQSISTGSTTAVNQNNAGGTAENRPRNVALYPAIWCGFPAGTLLHI